MRKNCNICGLFYTGHGNNAYPVIDGECCDECNIGVVLPARMAMMRHKK